MQIPKGLPTGIEEVLKRVKDDIEVKETKRHVREEGKCPLCNGNGLIYNRYRKRYFNCKCQSNKNVNSSMKGLSSKQLNKTFKNFIVWNETSKNMKDTTTNYYLRYERIVRSKNNSFALLGQEKSGKSHLLSALMNKFIFEKNKEVKYISLDKINEGILNNKTILEKYKNAELLAIDNFLETNKDINIIYNLLVYRGYRKLPVMITSKYSIEEIKAINQAIGQVISDITKGNRLNVIGKSNIYRLNN